MLAEIATVRPLPPVAEPAEARPSGRGRRFPALVAAAAAVVALVAGGVAWQVINDPDEPPRSRCSQADDAERFTQTFPGGATATVVRSKDLNQAVLITEDMPPAPDGHSYALWLQHDDRHGAGRDHAERRRQPGPAQR